jgi:tetratricopeptide (TPR) repeat protein
VILYAITPAVLVVLAAAVYFVNVPAIRANTTLIQAMSPQTSGGPEQNLALFQKALSYNSFGSSEVLEQLIQISVQVTSSNQVSASTKENFYKVTKEAIEKKIASTPNDSRYLLFAGEFFNQYGQYDQALSYLERALKNSPNKQTIYFEAGTSYLGKGDYANAELQFKKAYDLAPSYPDAAIIYAVGAIYSKDNETLKVLLPQIGEEKNKRIYICNTCKREKTSKVLCKTCSGWNMVPFGIGTDTVVEEVQTLFPKAKIIQFDKEHITTEKIAKRAMAEFYETPGFQRQKY